MLRLNLPSAERLLRVLLGAGFAGCGWAAFAQPNLIVMALGLCVALTGLIGFCPVCAVSGRRPTPGS